MKRRIREADEADWRLHIAPRFGLFPLVAISGADVASWVGGMVAAGRHPSGVARYLATLRSMLSFAIADGRLSINVAAEVKAPSGAQMRREGLHLTVDQLVALHQACQERYAELVMVLGPAGLRWGELSGLRGMAGAGADPKVVQRVLGHASAAMTMDLCGHLIDEKLWDAAQRLGGTPGAPDGSASEITSGELGDAGR